MNRLLRGVALSTLTIVAASRLLAQHEQHGGGGGQLLGSVKFPVSCNAAGQQSFELGLAQLHSFWFEESGKSFQAAAQADPACGMAYWGQALTYWGNPFAAGPAGNNLKLGAEAAQKAEQVGAPTPRERGYIQAAAALYRDHATALNAPRLRAYSDAMAKVHAENPDDPEAAIYYALSLTATASPTDTTFTRQKRAAAILNPLFARFPSHPGLAHYIIHSNDSPRLAHLGLDAARRYASIAPSAPHAQHMPSHIFIRLGLWDENIKSNQASYEAGVAYNKAQGHDGMAGHEFHAMDYMVYGFLQLGQDSAAERWTNHALSQAQLVPGSLNTYDYSRTAMAARIWLERGRWAEAARLTVPSTTFGAAEAIGRFSRGVGAVRSGDTATARTEVDQLARLENDLKTRQDNYWARVAGIKRRAVEAWILLAARQTEPALALAREAADMEDVTEKHPVTPGEPLPARELYADMLMEVGRPADARKAYETTLTREPNRARSLFGAARAAELAGDKAAARTKYQTFLKQMAGSDGKRPEIAMAKKQG